MINLRKIYSNIIDNVKDISNKLKEKVYYPLKS